MEQQRRPRIGQPASARGFVAQDIVISSALDPLLSLKALAAYSSLSPRRLRMYLDAAPSEALPCFRVGGRVLVRRSVFDAWLEQFSSRGRPSLATALKSIGLAPRP